MAAAVLCAEATTAALDRKLCGLPRVQNSGVWPSCEGFAAEHDNQARAKNRRKNEGIPKARIFVRVLKFPRLNIQQYFK